MIPREQTSRRNSKAGKTTLGRDAAKMLGFEFDDLDEALARVSDRRDYLALEKQVITHSAGGKLPPEIVAEQGSPAARCLSRPCHALAWEIMGGWDKFRALEADCFQKTASGNKASLSHTSDLHTKRSKAAAGRPRS